MGNTNPTAAKRLLIVETEGHGEYKRVALVAEDGFELYAGNGVTLDDARATLHEVAFAYMIGKCVLDLTQEPSEEAGDDL